MWLHIFSDQTIAGVHLSTGSVWVRKSVTSMSSPLQRFATIKTEYMYTANIKITRLLIL